MDKQLKCDFCDGIFKRKQNLARHTSLYHEKPRDHTKIQCKMCEKQFSFSHLLEQHEKRIHSENTHPCDLCEKMFSNRNLLERHIDYVHNENKVRFKCDLCDKSYKSNDYLLAHIKSFHENQNDYKCNQCEKAYRSEFMLQ